MTGERDVTLICLPFAGAGASFFRPWAALAGDHVEIVAPQLPGRERRIDDEPYRSVPAAAEGLLPEVADRFVPGRSLVLFGHSLGAVLAFELACRLAARGFVPDGLVVSGSPGPWSPREQRATGLPDDEFLGRVQEFAGYSHAALADPEMRELVLPALRADVEMHESYRPGHDTPLAAPIAAIRGSDDHLVSAEEAGQWARATAKDFVLVEAPGGHMYLTDDARHVLRQVESIGA
ncbi:thioesterase II family protein [Lentzea sp. NPDC060358]|uniref:thioesterase II family protein n=1 Tax=Lentzea sp. NPDC060358 TaxID=3347103 RepID=UPI003662E909